MTWKLQGQSRIMRFDETLHKQVYSPTVYVDGKGTRSLIGQVAVLANVQPMSGRDLLLVPEHQRFLEQYWAFVQVPYSLATGDVVKRDGINYQVQNVESWGSFERCRIMRIDVGPDRNP